MNDPASLAVKTAELLAEHYQHTFTLTYDYWQQRNRLFLILIAVIAVGSLLLFRVQGADLLVIALLRSLSGLDSLDISPDQFRFLQSLLLIVVFYLVFNMHHRNLAVLRNYQYLGQMEREIRARLGLGKEEASFTREGDYYWQSRTWGQRAAKWVYIILLGLGLLLFLIGRLVADFQTGAVLAVVLEALISAATLFYYVLYAVSSPKLDRPDRDPKPGVDQRRR